MIQTSWNGSGMCCILEMRLLQRYMNCCILYDKRVIFWFFITTTHIWTNFCIMQTPYSPITWSPPPMGVIKANFDASSVRRGTAKSKDLIFRNHLGGVIFGETWTCHMFLKIRLNKQKSNFFITGQTYNLLRQTQNSSFADDQSTTTALLWLSLKWLTTVPQKISTL